MRRPTTDTLPDALRHFDQLPDSAHVRQPVVQHLYGFGGSTLWRRVQAGAIPAPVKLGPRTTAWNVGDLRRDLAAKRVGPK